MNRQRLNDGRAVLEPFKRLGSEFFWIGAGQTAVAAGSLAGVSLLTRALSPEAYGELALGMTVALLAQQAAMGPLAGAFLRFYSAALDARELPTYLSASKRLIGIATLATLGTAIVIATAFCALRQTKWLALLAAAFLFSLLSGYNTAMDAIQNAARQRAIVALHQGANQWLRFTVALALLACLGVSSSVAMLGFGLASLAVLVSQLLFFYRGVASPQQISEPIEAEKIARWRRQMGHYAWPIAFWGVFTWAQSSADRWALQVCQAPREVGFYAALYQLGYSPMVLLSNFLVQLFSPILFSRAGDGTDSVRVAHSHRLYIQLMVALAAFAGVAVAVAWLGHVQIFSLFVAPQYQVVSPLLPLMVSASSLFCLGQAATLSLLSSLDTKALLWPKITTALVGTALSFVGAFYLGIRGVVYAGVLCAFFYLGWVLVLVYRQRRLATSACEAKHSLDFKWSKAARRGYEGEAAEAAANEL